MKENTGKTVALAALAVSVIGLGVGFAAFSRTLTLQSSATVKPSDDTFSVKFNAAGGTVAPTTTGATGSTATVTDTTVSGMKAAFTAPGQSVTYTVPVLNDGEYVAYLNSINYASGVSCTAGSSATDSLVQAACSGIEVSVKAGSDAAVTTSKTSITGHTLAAKSGTEDVVITISYKEGSSRADGDFTVAIGDITLDYGSAD